MASDVTAGVDCSASQKQAGGIVKSCGSLVLHDHALGPVW
jgi:hypothetical protein